MTILPLTLYKKPSPLRDWLTLYKVESFGRRELYTRFLAATVDRVLHENKSRLTWLTEEATIVSVVPSSTRVGPHPLMQLLASGYPFEVPYGTLLKRGVGYAGRRVYNPHAFVPTSEIAGEQVILVDDVYTTGARAQSAAAALAAHGATVLAIVVIARRVNPDFNEASAGLWSRQSQIPYDYGHAMDWLDQAVD